MSNAEMAVKIVLGKHIVEDMLADGFWRMLTSKQPERFFRAVEETLETLPLKEIPRTDKEASDLLFSWTIPVRAAVLNEFLPDVAKIHERTAP